MRKLILLIVSLFMLAVPAGAQDSTPPQVREAALNAAQQALGSRATSWRYEILGEISSSNLGCPLVTGSELPAPVTVYRVILTYADGQEYVVHTSGDGTRVQLCDSKFGSAGSPPPAVTQPGTVSCTVTAEAGITLYAAPNFESEAVAAPAAGYSAPGVGRTADTTWLQIIHTGGGIAWVYATNISTTGDCASLPVTAATDPDAVTTACFVSPAGAFANVRAQPSIDAQQVSTIYENTSWQVTARNTDGTWFYINPGWVASSVVTLSGECNGVPVNENAVGAGSGVDETTPATDVASILNNFACPAGFAGYMTPRISIGSGTAQVDSGGVPNRIRAYPSTNPSVGEQLGTANPGRTLDRVINGPVCNEVYVWWYVEIDGVQGWTAESDADNDTYFLTPVGEPAATPAATTASAGGSSDVDDVPSIALEQNNRVDLLGFSPDDSLLIVGVEENTELAAYEMPQLAPSGDNMEASGAAFISFDFAGDNTLAAMTGNGDLVFWNMGNRARIRTFEGVHTDFYGGPIDFNTTGSLFVTSACVEGSVAGCDQGLVDLWDGVAGQPVRRQPAHPDAPSLAIFSPDDEMIASASTDSVQLWDVQSGAFITSFDNATPAEIADVAFTEDSAAVFRAVCAEFAPASDPAECTQSDVRGFDIESGEEIFAAYDHTAAVNDILIDESGAYLLSAGDDGFVYVYDIETGERLLALQPFGGEPVLTLALTDDNRALAVGGTQAPYLLVYDLETRIAPVESNGIG